jgi:hypothetical protein
MAFHLKMDSDPDPAYHFNADPDEDPDPAYHFDADPNPTFQSDAEQCRSGSKNCQNLMCFRFNVEQTVQ